MFRAPLVLVGCALGLCALVTAEVGVDVVSEQANFTTTATATTTAARGGGESARGPEGPQGTSPQPRSSSAAPAFVLRLRVVDSLSRQPLSAASIHIYINFSRTFSAQTGDDGDAWFHVPRQTNAVVSAVASKHRYVSALVPITTTRTPVFSSVTLPLLAVNRGNMWLFNDSVLISIKSTGVFGADPLVQVHSSGLSLSADRPLSSLSAVMNSPSVWTAEGALLHSLGLVSTSSGFMSVDLTPVASVSVQLWSSGSSLNLSSPVYMKLPVCESCGLQEGDHVPAWTLNHTTGGWMRKGLGLVESMDGRLVWTFTAPHLGHWMAAPLSPSRGVRLEAQVDFILRHGSFLMILLGSTLVVAVCLLLGLLCHPRPSHKDKPRRPAVNPLQSVRDQSTSTCEDQVVLLTNYSDRRYNIVSNLNHDQNITATELQQDRDSAVAVTLNNPEQQLQNDAQTFGNGLFFYNQPVAILHASAFFQMDEISEQQFNKSASLPRMDPQENFTETKKTNTEKQNAKEDVRMPETKCKGFPESVSEPGTLGQTAMAAQGPRAWFVSLEGKPVAGVRYNVSEEEQRSRREAGSRDTSLVDSGVDLSEGSKVKLERNATFVKKSSNKQSNG